jgi:hypothetical protein
MKLMVYHPTPSRLRRQPGDTTQEALAIKELGDREQRKWN